MKFKWIYMYTILLKPYYEKKTSRLIFNEVFIIIIRVFSEL